MVAGAIFAYRGMSFISVIYTCNARSLSAATPRVLMHLIKCFAQTRFRRTMVNLDAERTRRWREAEENGDEWWLAAQLLTIISAAKVQMAARDDRDAPAAP